MAQMMDEFGGDLADFVRRVGELRSARALPAQEQQTVLDAALFELQHVAENLWPRYEQIATAAPGGVANADRQETRLLKALFQRTPLPVVLVDRETVVRRMNFAATGLTDVRAGYATGRPLAGLLTPGDRAAFRSQAAAVARGEGDRSLTVHLQQRPDEPLLATLSALRPPDEPQPAVLVVFQPGLPRGALGAAPAGRGRRPPLPDLTETTRHAELMDLLDTMSTAMLSTDAGDRDGVLEAASRVLHGRFADWVVADGTGPLRRTAVRGPEGTEAAVLREALLAQDPESCPLVSEAHRGGSASLQVRPEDTEGFGRDGAGSAVLVRADVTSLLCVPLTLPSGPVQGVLTLFRTGARPAFSMAEGQAMDVMSRHAALAMRRP
ncbi:PAS domain-containing protein [Streptomyces beijiangensis]|uniref:PAS domain-containing protein n=1 Tax=Streptomyces beijiangensis TaxID=163361 RepID=A0A939F5U2_9ACTN|nr:PAS domain-containing protein [Streptomyces beijiangensis]MBO0512198.1 PAS domain-containing protein [Streptomyces beijiangensis]